jgi:hypothetical protein
MVKNNCFACGNTGKVTDCEDFYITICNHCNGSSVENGEIDVKDFYVSTMKQILNYVKESGFTIVDAPCFLTDNDEAKVVKVYTFSIRENVETEFDKVKEGVVSFLRDNDIKYVYVVAWNYINKWMVRGSC